MAEWIDGVKCINSLGCGLMLSLLLSLAIQANIAFSSKACNEKGDELDGTSQCVINDIRIWNLTIFYVGAIIFLIGSLGTCLNNGYVFCVHLLALIVWIGAIIGISFQRMSCKDSLLIISLNY